MSARTTMDRPQRYRIVVDLLKQILCAESSVRNLQMGRIIDQSGNKERVYQCSGSVKGFSMPWNLTKVTPSSGILPLFAARSADKPPKRLN
jgi:hypothetical protein